MKSTLVLSLLVVTLPYHLDQPAAKTAAQHILLGQSIDINTADATALEALPGIGPKLAERIILDRTQHGLFNSVEDLDRVPGMGEKLLARVRSYLTVSSKY